MENKKSNCLCGSGEYIVMSCSGASDVGQISDLVARKLRDNGVRKMNCLAVVGAGIKKSIESFKAKEILIIDGCPVDCGKKIMLQNKLDNFKYIRITDLGYKKGETPINKDVIDNIYDKVETIY